MGLLANEWAGAGASSKRYRNPNVKPAWYKSRQRSITPAQKRIERTLWPIFGLTFAYNQRIQLDQAFGRQAPTVLEIGCGAGEAIVELAEAQPEANFVGCDWFRSGLATCLKSIEERNLTNVRLVRADAATLLDRGLPAEPLFDEVKIFFPDPWYGSPERRVVRSEVVRQISARMRPSGFVHVATDVADYPAHVREVFASPLASGGVWRADTARRVFRPSTRYAREGVAEGRSIEDLHFAFEGLHGHDDDEDEPRSAVTTRQSEDV
jgi:tRNA (guanine-N7-)-methyltransferase